MTDTERGVELIREALDEADFVTGGIRKFTKEEKKLVELGWEQLMKEAREDFEGEVPYLLQKFKAVTLES